MSLNNFTDQNVQYPNRFTIKADGTNGTVSDAALNGKVVQFDFNDGGAFAGYEGGTPLNAFELNKLITQINANDIAIVANDGDISTNAAGIAANLAAITSNDTDISTNAGNISTNVAAIALNTAKTGITAGQASAIVTNTAKVGITAGQASAITTNTAKVGITTTQASNIVTNNSKVGITTTQAANIVTNNAKVGITTGQASAIVANTAKTGITAQQTLDITANNAKVGITTAQANSIAANNLKISYVDSAAVALNTAKNSFPSAAATKVGFISVTESVDLDAMNETIGSLGTGLEGALPLSGGVMSGNISMVTDTVKYSITDMADPTNLQDASTKKYTDDQDDLRLLLTGGALTGALAMGENKITNIADGTEAGDAVNLGQIETFADNYALLSGSVFYGNIDMNQNKIIGIPVPTGASGDTEGVPKSYVDGIVSGYLKADGTIPMVGNLDLANNRLTNVGTPTADGDAVPKSFVVDANDIQDTAIALNTAKVGITTGQADAIVLNTAKVGITTTQANAIVANTAKISYDDTVANAALARTGGTMSGTINMDGAGQVINATLIESNGAVYATTFMRAPDGIQYVANDNKVRTLYSTNAAGVGNPDNHNLATYTAQAGDIWIEY